MKMKLLLANVTAAVRLFFYIRVWRFQDFVRQQKSMLVSRSKGFRLPTVHHDFPIPPNSNPFHYDSFHMGTPLVRGWMVMHEGHDRPEEPRDLQYIVLINTRTGQRIRVRFN
jgi:hypothetical protein